MIFEKFSSFCLKKDVKNYSHLLLHALKTLEDYTNILIIIYQIKNSYFIYTFLEIRFSKLFIDFFFLSFFHTFFIYMMLYNKISKINF